MNDLDTIVEILTREQFEFTRYDSAATDWWQHLEPNSDYPDAVTELSVSGHPAGAQLMFDVAGRLIGVWSL